MPTPDLIQGVPLPVYDDPAAIPDDLANIFYANLSRGIPRFSTTAQRDAAYPSPVDGQHAWITADRTLYVRSGGAWVRAIPLTASGLASVPLTNSSTGSVDVALPAGRFSATPVVGAVSAHNGYFPYVVARSASSITLGVRHWQGTAATTGVGVLWTAIQTN